MAAVTIEDLQGSIEIIVFPKLYEQTGPIWADGSILLVAGRVDHRGDDVSILADLVTTWDEAAVKGPEAFAREVAAGDRGAFRRRPAGGPNGVPVGSAARNGNGSENGGHAIGGGPGAVASVGRPESPTTPAGRPAAARRADIPYVSPLRPDAEPVAGLPSIAPAEPIPTYAAAGPTNGPASDRDEEPALPDEARAREAEAVVAPTIPLEAPGANQVMHVRFGGAPADKLVRAMETFRQLTRERPGDTRVVVHVPAPGGSALPMELKQTVAYDADLLAEVGRRLGEGVVQISLG